MLYAMVFKGALRHRKGLGMESGTGRTRFVCSVALSLVCLWIVIGSAQGNQLLPGGTGTRGPSPFTTNLSGLPALNQGSASAGVPSLRVTDQLLRPFVSIPSHLRFGYLYTGGGKFSNGLYTVDAFAPWGIRKTTRLFGQAHGDFQKFTGMFGGNSASRADLSVGGGVRQILRDKGYVGLNAFYDTTRLGGQWYSSSGLGLEYWGNLTGADTMDLAFNYYGDLFSGSNTIVSAFRTGKANIDFEAGYSTPLLNQSLQLRLKGRGYAFDVGDRIYGWAAGADLTTTDRLLSLRYEVGHDKINGTYQTIGCFASVDLDLNNLAGFGNPLVRRKPIYGSPPDVYNEADNQDVKRQFSGPGAVSLPVLSGNNCRYFRTIGLHSHTYPPGIADDYESFAPVDHTAITTLEITVTHSDSITGDSLFLLLADAGGGLLAIIPTGAFATVSPGPVTDTFVVSVAGLTGDPAQLDLYTSAPLHPIISVWSATLCFQ